MNNPILNRKNFLLYLLLWLFFCAIDFAFLNNTLKLDLKYALLDCAVFNTLFMSLGLGFWYPVNYLSFDKNPFWKVISNHLAASLAASVIWVSAGYLILTDLIRVNETYRVFVINSLNWRLVNGMLYYTTIVALYYIYIYYVNLQNKTIKEQELKLLVNEAELRSLKYQINPHFLFNSLNSISSLTLTNATKAHEMTIMLSDYLRATLANNETQFNKLSDEISNARLYLEIEKIRFSDKFQFIENTRQGCLNVEVPNMIIQPLLENAMKYGVYESIEKVIIRLRCAIENNYLKLTVENNFDSDNSSVKGEKIGLNNIRNRLKLIYNQDNLLVVNKTNNLFTVDIFIPLETVHA